jgi:hypothetical protein
MTPNNPVPPYRFCDLVMKGGITSGVVYPLAAVKLSEQFIFKNIGGTSAGAIAAAATAAAELARASGGFERLNGLPKFICGASSQKGKSNLFAFFQPQPKTKRFFEVAVAALGKGWSAKVRVGWRVFLGYFWAVLFGAVPSGIFFYFALQSSGGWFFVLCTFVAAILLAMGVLLNVAFDLSIAGEFLRPLLGHGGGFQGREGQAPGQAGEAAHLLADGIPQRIRGP